jgi:hypothetical protein
LIEVSSGGIGAGAGPASLVVSAEAEDWPSDAETEQAAAAAAIPRATVSEKTGEIRMPPALCHTNPHCATPRREKPRLKPDLHEKIRTE